MTTLPKDYKDYAVISKRKETLETLVSYIKTIQREDSLQKVAKMPEIQRTKFIEKMIAKMEQDEIDKKEALDLLAAKAANPNNPAGVLTPAGARRADHPAGSLLGGGLLRASGARPAAPAPRRRHHAAPVGQLKTETRPGLSPAHPHL